MQANNRQSTVAKACTLLLMLCMLASLCSGCYVTARGSEEVTVSTGIRF